MGGGCREAGEEVVIFSVRYLYVRLRDAMMERNVYVYWVIDASS